MGMNDNNWIVSVCVYYSLYITVENVMWISCLVCITWEDVMWIS